MRADQLNDIQRGARFFACVESADMRVPGRRSASGPLRHRWSEPRAAAVAVSAVVLSTYVRLAHGFRGIVQGDTNVDVYINSVYIRTDTISPVLPFNSQRRYYVGEQGAWSLRLNNELEPGDVIAMKATTSNPTLIEVRQAIGTSDMVPGLVAVIGAFEDGTMTNDQWRCDENYAPGWTSQRFNDSHWPFAIVQPRSCCPWRDETHAWKRLNAEWISPPLGNATGPREFFCRYMIQDVPRLMDGSEVMGNDTEAPRLTMNSLEVGASLTQVKFSLSAAAQVSCQLVDARYELRPPTPMELHELGISKNLGANDMVWVDVTGDNSGNGFNDPALEWATVANAMECTQRCEDYVGDPPCRAITFYDVGQDTTNGHNCKLMAAFDGDVYAIPDVTLTHKFHQVTTAVHKMTLPDLLLPGTVYNVYCSAMDLDTGKHSTWERVAASKITARTAGCFDCGEQAKPITKLLGGYATRDSIVAVVQSSQPGRVICWPRVMTPYLPFTLTLADVKANANFSGLITRAFYSVQITMTPLTNNTLHEVGCMAESEAGKDSSDDNFKDQLRRWHTEEDAVPLIALTLTPKTWRDEFSMTARARLSSIGYLWCQVFTTDTVMEDGVPTLNLLKNIGLRVRVRDPRLDSGGVFGGLFTNTTYEVYCTSMWSDFRNETDDKDDLAPDYPVVTILRWTVGYDEVRLIVNIDKSPASTFCVAEPWTRRPYSKPPLLPDAQRMKQSPFRKDTLETFGGDTIMVITGLDTGWWHDVYCYSEEWTEPPPPEAQPPPVRGMRPIDIRRTRLKIKTRGPESKDGSWRCVAGQPCGITGLLGEGVSSVDKVMARADQCPGRCQCNGEEDPDQKGASCSPVSHSRLVNAPDPGAPADEVDPRGPWCYVDPGTCTDAERSRTFPTQLISYRACTFQNSTIDLPGVGPPGFPDNGMAQPASPNGDAYNWRGGPLVAPGAGYHVCWCNGSSSPCAAVIDFRLRIGLMDLTGPSSAQADTLMECIAGEPCTLRYFGGYGLADGNRLVPVPLTAAGCNWERANPADPLAPPGFPNNGITQPATHGGSVYSWGSTEPVRADGGLYVLCWCGTLAPNGSYDCPLERPVDGSHYLAPGGTLAIVGPRTGAIFTCNVGVECIIQDVPGHGLQGGDLVSAMEVCGQGSTAPPGWTSGLPSALFHVAAMNSTKTWEEGGWLTYGALLNGSQLAAAGSPLHADETLVRGVWGFPNRGMSVPDPRIGYYSFGLPVQALPGDYALCWCGAQMECASPTQFRMLVGVLRLQGPAALPGTAQVFKCIRNRQCEVHDVEGVWPSSGGQLFIASSNSRCGGAPAVGVPRNGISLPSQNGRSFSWGELPVSSPPGKYRLCWCATLVYCDFGDFFKSFAAVMIVKAPFGPDRRFLCGVGERCVLEGIYGEGSTSSDKVMVMTVCEHGVGSDGFENRGQSQITGPDGTWFEMPVARSSGRYRVCWCAGETLCIRGADFSHDLGMLIVGGPDRSVLYKCFEWATCEITLIGTDLTNGDRLRVVPPGLDCKHNGTITSPAGFPNAGFSFPATSSGAVYHWGSSKVRTPPGIYGLCWCSRLTEVCDENSEYPLIGGTLEVGTAREYMYINRPPDNEDRGQDSWYPYLMAIPVVVLFLAAGIIGWRKLQSRLPDPAAPHPFPKKKAWAAIEQDKARTVHALKEVTMNRLVALGQVTDVTNTSITEEDIPAYRVTPEMHKKRPQAIKDRVSPFPALQDSAQHALEDDPWRQQNALEDASQRHDRHLEEMVAPRIASVHMSGRVSSGRPTISGRLRSIFSSGKHEVHALRGVRRQTRVATPSTQGSVSGRAGMEELGNIGLVRSWTNSGSSGKRGRGLRDTAHSDFTDRPPTADSSGSRPDTSESAKREADEYYAAVGGDRPITPVPTRNDDEPQQPAMPGGFEFQPFRDPRKREVLLRVLDL